MPRGILHQVEVTDDCRAFRRLPINRSVRYTILGEKKKLRQVALGKTINMSAGGVLFTTESPLPEPRGTPQNRPVGDTSKPAS